MIGRALAVNPIAVHLRARPTGRDPVLGRITIEFKSLLKLLNLLGTIHGGVLAAMLDISMSFLALCTMGGNRIIPTIDMTINFIAPAKPGLTIGKGEVVHKGRPITFMEGRLCPFAAMVSRMKVASSPNVHDRLI